MKTVQPSAEVLRQIKAKRQQIYAALGKEYASVIKAGALTWPIGNSIVHASMSMDLTSILSYSNSPKGSEVSLSGLVICGPREDEPLHTHPPAIIGFIEYGSGRLLTVKNKREVALPFRSHDIVIIPSNAPHSFTTSVDKEFRYNALLIGPKGGNYQAHYFD